MSIFLYRIPTLLALNCQVGSVESGYRHIGPTITAPVSFVGAASLEHNLHSDRIVSQGTS